MPTFHAPVKRKSDVLDHNPVLPKRAALEKGEVPTRDSGGTGASRNAGGEQFWMVQWRAPQYRKHKTWDGDAVLVVKGNSCTLYDVDGKTMSSGKPHGLEGPHQIVEGANFSVGSKELEVDRAISRADFLSGRCFGGGGMTSPAPAPAPSAAKQFVPLRPKAINALRPIVPSGDKGKGKAGGVQLEPVSLVSSSPQKDSQTKTRESYWAVNWRKPQQKKHKTWDGDAFLAHRDGTLTLISEKGIVMGKKKWDGLPLYSSYRTSIGGKDIELTDEHTRGDLPRITGTSDEPLDVDLEDSAPSPPSTSRFAQSPLLLQNQQSRMTPNSPSLSKSFVPPTSFYAQPPKPKAKGPLHDPAAEGAIVMKAPTKEHEAKFNKKNLPTVAVVIDPILGRHLRPHQQEGVKFLYECVMGMRKHEGQGCILADEMGMGKTLQTITLVWTLLKQNPYAGAGPVTSKVLIVCPVTLINNWKSEFHKWLGKDRVGIFTGDKDKNVIKQFVNSRIHHVLIIGYERLRSVISELAYCQPPIGLIICDEGHRLKSANNKTSTMFEALRTRRRVILSGTPIQNDLGEFHAMADFCNPGLLDDYQTFRRVYETPILKSRAPGASSKESELGEARSAQLAAIARSFVLRREASILKQYLPPKYEYVVFITPTQLQLSIFAKILNADKLGNLVRNSTAESLALINMLTKISNSPILLKATVDQAKSRGEQAGDLIKRAAIEEAVKLLPERAQIEDVSLSGKLAALANLLRKLYKNTEEKCIIVSHYTSTLNIIEAFCQKRKYTYHRLDGQTPAPKRQEYVNDFNKSSQSKRFIFLLSSKAGGVGLNLIGASRLCLIDSDWNPSHDLQSMARIHRDGQKRPVYIYRFLTAGTIDEKIYQRQVTKLGLSDSLMGTGSTDSKSDSFTRKDLQDIFTIYPNTACNTHDLLECPCDGSDPQALNELRDSEGTSDGESDIETGFIVASQVRPEQIEKQDRAYVKQKKAQLAALGEWTHINCLKAGSRYKVQDEVLGSMLYVSEEEPVKAQTQSLLDAVSLETVLAADRPPLTVTDVPGGTISFLFERSSEVPVEGDEASEREL